MKVTSNAQKDQLTDYIPWAAIVAPGVILNKNGSLQSTLKIRGKDLESSSQIEIMQAAAQINNAFKRLEGNTTIHVESQRLKVEDYPDETYQTPQLWLLDTERRENFSQQVHYESQYFLTITFLPDSDKGNFLDKVLYKDESEKGSVAQRRLEDFVAMVSEAADMLSEPLAATLATDDETLTYLHSTVSPNKHRITVPDIPMYLDAYIVDEPLNIRRKCLEFDTGDKIGCIYLRGFGKESEPAIFNQLNNLNMPYRWVTRFICLDPEQAEKELSLYQKKWFGARKSAGAILKEAFSNTGASDENFSDQNAVANAQETSASLQLLKSKDVSFGYLVTMIFFDGKTEEELQEKSRSIRKIINSLGFVAKDEGLNLFKAWLSSLPGNFTDNIRRPLLHSLNLSHLIPMSAVWSGKNDSNLKERLGIDLPLMTCSTSGNTPFKLSLNVGDIGHFAVFGPTGSGKSTLLGMLALSSQKYPMNVVIFDKDKSSLVATKLADGEFYEPGSETAQGFQPLRHLEKPEDITFATEFIELLIELSNHALTPLMSREIHSALVAMANEDKEHRTLSLFDELVQDRAIKDILRPYTTGHLSFIFNCVTPDTASGHWRTFEMNKLMAMGNAAIVPALDYMFHMLDRQFDGTPTIMLLDESWLFLTTERFEKKLKDWLKTLRKKLVYVGFLTQEAADAVNSNILPTILSACQTRIYLPDQEATQHTMAKAYQQLGLTDSEILLLSQATPKREYFFKSSAGTRLFNMNLGDVALAYISSKPEDIEFAEKYSSDKSSTEFAKDYLKHKNMHWASELIESAEQSLYQK